MSEEQQYYEADGTPVGAKQKPPTGGEVMQEGVKRAAPYIGRFAAASLPAIGAIAGSAIATPMIGGAAGAGLGSVISTELKNEFPNIFGERPNPITQALSDIGTQGILPGVAGKLLTSKPMMNLYRGIPGAIKSEAGGAFNPQDIGPATGDMARRMAATMMSSPILRNFPAVRQEVAGQVAQKFGDELGDLQLVNKANRAIMGRRTNVEQGQLANQGRINVARQIESQLGNETQLAQRNKETIEGLTSEAELYRQPETMTLEIAAGNAHGKYKELQDAYEAAKASDSEVMARELAVTTGKAYRPGPELQAAGNAIRDTFGKNSVGLTLVKLHKELQLGPDIAKSQVYKPITTQILSDVTHTRNFLLATGDPATLEQLALNELTTNGFKEFEGTINAKGILDKLTGPKHEIYETAITQKTFDRYKNLMEEIERQKGIAEASEKYLKTAGEIKIKHVENLSEAVQKSYKEGSAAGLKSTKEAASAAEETLKETGKKAVEKYTKGYPISDRLLSYSQGHLIWTLPLMVGGAATGHAAISTIGAGATGIVLTNKILAKLMSNEQTSQLVLKALETPKSSSNAQLLNVLFSDAVRTLQIPMQTPKE